MSYKSDINHSWLLVTDADTDFAPDAASLDLDSRCDARGATTDSNLEDREGAE